MRISPTPNATPKSTPPSKAGSKGGADPDQPGDEQYIWTTLVPRLVHPTKLAIVRALIEAGRPLSAEGLLSQSPAIDGTVEKIKTHAESMVEAGALEVASAEIKVGGEILLFFFPHPQGQSR